MKNLNLLEEIIRNLKPTPPIFTVNVIRGYSEKLKLTRMSVDRHQNSEDVYEVNNKLNNLCLKHFSEQFNPSLLRYEIQTDSILQSCLTDIKTDLKDFFVKVSPNKQPTLTKTFKILKENIYSKLTDELHEMMLSIWLYKEHSGYVIGEDKEKAHKNIHGLLCLTSEKIGDYLSKHI